MKLFDKIKKLFADKYTPYMLLDTVEISDNMLISNKTTSEDNEVNLKSETFEIWVKYHKKSHKAKYKRIKI